MFFNKSQLLTITLYIFWWKKYFPSLPFIIFAFILSVLLRTSNNMITLLCSIFILEVKDLNRFILFNNFINNKYVISFIVLYSNAFSQFTIFSNSLVTNLTPHNKFQHTLVPYILFCYTIKFCYLLLIRKTIFLCFFFLLFSIFFKKN